MGIRVISRPVNGERTRRAASPLPKGTDWCGKEPTLRPSRTRPNSDEGKS
jgi:hypothetical protein